MEEEKYYCAMCDVELEKRELLDNCCPFCNTGIPDAVDEDDEMRRGDNQG